MSRTRRSLAAPWTGSGRLASVPGVDAAQRLSQTPVNRLLGLRLVDRASGRASLELATRAELTQEEGVVHGGILTALADTAAVYALHPDLPPHQTMTGVTLQMNFLAPADPRGAPLRAEGRLLRRGRTIALCESTVHQGDVLVAKGSFTYLLRERRPS